MNYLPTMKLKIIVLCDTASDKIDDEECIFSKLLVVITTLFKLQEVCLFSLLLCDGFKQKSL